MTVYVDQARHRFGRMVMGHMIADTLDELHRMAEAIGMRRSWFQPTSFPHYDVSLTRRASALALGAVEVDPRQLATIMRRLRGHPAPRGNGQLTDSWAEPSVLLNSGAANAIQVGGGEQPSGLAATAQPSVCPLTVRAPSD